MARSNPCDVKFAKKRHQLTKSVLTVYGQCERRKLLTAMQFLTHTAYIVWAQDVASSHTDIQHDGY